MTDGEDIEASIRAVVACALPSLYIDSVEKITSGRTHAVYRVKNLTNPNLVFQFRPNVRSRPVTADHHAIIAEASLLQWIRNSAESPTVIEETSDDESSVSDVETQLHTHAKSIQAFSGKLLEHGSMQPDDTPYNLVTSPEGISLAEYTQIHDTADLKSTTFQIGRLIRRISLLKSPTARFGTARYILPSVPCRNHWMRYNMAEITTGETYSHWSVAFDSLLRRLIQDAERLTLMIWSHRVHECFDRFKHYLNGVSEPSLVIVDAGSQINTLVHPDASLEGNAVKVTGLREWSSAIFGDPLFTAAFVELPTEEIWNGYNTPLDLEQSSTDQPSTTPSIGRRAAVRLLLYQMYHGIEKVVKGFTSREEGSYDIELDGRRKLIAALRKLEGLGDDGKPAREPPLLQSMPAKRLKPNKSRSCR